MLILKQNRQLGYQISKILVLHLTLTHIGDMCGSSLNVTQAVFPHRLPYTMAAIYEVQRVGDLLPRGVAHRAIDDVFIGGYRIPKGKAALSLILVVMLVAFMLAFRLDNTISGACFLLGHNLQIV